MNAARKAQISWWTAKVYEQAQSYADIADPKRVRQDRIANKLDAITRLAKEIHFELTGKLPEVVKS
jgi:succinylarginine dihydrolase